MLIWTKVGHACKLRRNSKTLKHPGPFIRISCSLLNNREWYQGQRVRYASPPELHRLRLQPREVKEQKVTMNRLFSKKEMFVFVG